MGLPLPADPRRTALAAGLVTAAAGTVLVARSRDAARAAPVASPATLRAIGVADLVLVPGLLAGRPRWPWMAARGAFNVATAAVLLGGADRAGSPTGARVVSAALLALTIVDAGAAVELRGRERR